MTSNSLIEAIALRLSAEEGSVPYFYLDTDAVVTIAKGHAVGSEDAAVSLPWTDTYTQDEICFDWQAVKRSSRGKIAAAYASLTKCRMTDPQIEQVFRQDISEFLRYTRGHFTEFDSYPDGPQQAIMDICYNLGVSGFVSKYPKCTMAISRRNWELAAQQCWRRGISDQRNQTTQGLFRQGLTIRTV